MIKLSRYINNDNIYYLCIASIPDLYTFKSIQDKYNKAKQNGTRKSAKNKHSRSIKREKIGRKKSVFCLLDRCLLDVSVAWLENANILAQIFCKWISMHVHCCFPFKCISVALDTN